MTLNILQRVLLFSYINTQIVDSKITNYQFFAVLNYTFPQIIKCMKIETNTYLFSNPFCMKFGMWGL